MVPPMFLMSMDDVPIIPNLEIKIDETSSMNHFQIFRENMPEYSGQIDVEFVTDSAECLIRKILQICMNTICHWKKEDHENLRDLDEIGLHVAETE